MLRIEESAPSNIALIKYMGKSAQGNLPTNPSLSYTLENLRTYVEIEQNSEVEGSTKWEPLTGGNLFALTMNESGKDRYLKHFYFLKEKWGIHGSYTIRSANAFPSDCGLASSASSFAALTKATFQLAKALDLPSISSLKESELAGLSRLGSGSSCRSFYSPWALWDEEKVFAPKLPQIKLFHLAVVVEQEKKQVSSSLAHTRVSSSLLFEGRSQRAKTRLEELLKSLQSADWKTSCQLVWEEFWDMHVLFETSRPGFGYITPATLQILREVENHWKLYSDGPMVTLDAGPNVHLLFKTDLSAQTEAFLSKLKSEWRIIDSRDVTRV